MTTRAPAPRIPAAAERIRTALWQRSQARLRERHGFDLDAPDALERARALATAAPEDAEAHLLLGSVLAVRGDLEEAEREVRRAVELAPRLARARTTLATLLVRRGALEDGLREARNAAAIDLDDPAVLYNLALAEWVAGDRKTARAAFANAAGILQRERQANGSGDPTGSRRRWWQRWRWWRRHG